MRAPPQVGLCGLGLSPKVWADTEGVSGPLGQWSVNTTTFSVLFCIGACSGNPSQRTKIRIGVLRVMIEQWRVLGPEFPNSCPFPLTLTPTDPNSTSMEFT